MTIFIARSRDGFAVLLNSDVVRDCAVIEEARSFAAELAVREGGEHDDWIDVSDTGAPIVIRKD